MAKKPDPKMLGGGLAAKAARLLGNRRTQIEEEVAKATGTSKKKS